MPKPRALIPLTLISSSWVIIRRRRSSCPPRPTTDFPLITLIFGWRDYHSTARWRHWNTITPRTDLSSISINVSTQEEAKTKKRWKQSDKSEHSTQSGTWTLSESRFDRPSQRHQNERRRLPAEKLIRVFLASVCQCVCQCVSVSVGAHVR